MVKNENKKDKIIDDKFINEKLISSLVMVLLIP